MPSRFYTTLLKILVVLQAVTSAACGESPFEPTPPPAVASITVGPDLLAVVRGAQLQLTAIPKSATGEELRDRTVAWSTVHPALISVSDAGLVTGLAVGSATVRVSSGDIVREVEVKVLEPAANAIFLSATAVTLDQGRSQTLTAVVRNIYGEAIGDAVVTWESLNPAIATVANGAISALHEGTANIRARFGGLSADATLQVKPVFGGEMLLVMRDGDFSARRIHRLNPRAGTESTPVMLFNEMWQPVASPDGTKLAFTCSSAEVGICTSNIDGSDIRILTDTDLSYEDQPSWSPDGTKIAFRRWTQVGGSPGGPNPTDIWVMNADGSNQQNLTSDAISQHWPQWSPATVDGAQVIAFVQDSTVDGYQTSRLAVMRADGTQRRYLTNFGMHVEGRPSWKPDASSLVFSRLGGGYSNVILTVSSAGGNEQPFLSTTLMGGGQSYPTYSPNGNYIAFASYHEIVAGSTAPQIYTARADGTDIRRRTGSDYDKAELSWVTAP